MLNLDLELNSNIILSNIHTIIINLILNILLFIKNNSISLNKHNCLPFVQ
ncbi:MAG: hypothetical protein H6Q15_856 [Bacteroidetes bacterium]|nr:hypothetical protein [Bacteroidota bacterium]